MSLHFEVLATCGQARRGRLTTPHGVIETPAFMPVGTLGAVKGLSVDDLEQAGAQVMLSNLYHLTLRPGIDVIERLGGIHAFTSWQRPILTDSGGYQVFSLAQRRKLDASGVTFRSHVDGDEVRFTPESVVESQCRMGVDIAMMLDECPPWPIAQNAAAESLELTLRWAERARATWPDDQPGGLFGIVQGSGYEALRRQALAAMTPLDFHGYAIGGVSVGEGDALRRGVVEWIGPELPADKPRYLMGLGLPDDIEHGVRHGMDLFDCVIPARHARHGYLFTSGGVVRIKNARYRDDPAALDAASSWPLARRTSRAFLHHLFRTKEITAHVLATGLNVRFYLDFVQRLRERVESGTLTAQGDLRTAPADFRTAPTDT